MKLGLVRKMFIQLTFDLEIMKMTEMLQLRCDVLTIGMIGWVWINNPVVLICISLRRMVEVQT